MSETPTGAIHRRVQPLPLGLARFLLPQACSLLPALLSQLLEEVTTLPLPLAQPVVQQAASPGASSALVGGHRGRPSTTAVGLGLSPLSRLCLVLMSSSERAGIPRNGIWRSASKGGTPGPGFFQCSFPRGPWLWRAARVMHTGHAFATARAMHEIHCHAGTHLCASHMALPAPCTMAGLSAE